MYDYFNWKPYVPAAEKRRKAEREAARLRKKGKTLSPVVIEGRAIARTFWGEAWCRNLERYSDFSNRLPRGRSYVRGGAVLDLQVEPGEVKALVSGTRLYRVAVKVAGVPGTRWSSICADCAGAIDSLVELLQGRFSKGVMERICREKTGLFPAPAEIRFSCSCPDWATMCKHVAAVLYGIGARLDEKPELLFRLRRVDEKDLIVKAGRGLPLSNKGPAAERILAADGLSEIFGLELAEAVTREKAARKKPGKKKKKTAPGKTPGKMKKAPRRKPGRGRKPKLARRKPAKRRKRP